MERLGKEAAEEISAYEMDQEVVSDTEEWQ